MGRDPGGSIPVCLKSNIRAQSNHSELDRHRADIRDGAWTARAGATRYQTRPSTSTTTTAISDLSIGSTREPMLSFKIKRPCGADFHKAKELIPPRIFEKRCYTPHGRLATLGIGNGLVIFATVDASRWYFPQLPAANGYFPSCHAHNRIPNRQIR